jgi:hypothetical protein
MDTAFFLFFFFLLQWPSISLWVPITILLLTLSLFLISFLSLLLSLSFSLFSFFTFSLFLSFCPFLYSVFFSSSTIYFDRFNSLIFFYIVGSLYGFLFVFVSHACIIVVEAFFWINKLKINWNRSSLKSKTNGIDFCYISQWNKYYFAKSIIFIFSLFLYFSPDGKQFKYNE